MVTVYGLICVQMVDTVEVAKNDGDYGGSTDFRMETVESFLMAAVTRHIDEER